MAGFILRGLIAALGLWAATEMLDGFVINTPWTLVLAGLLLGVVNAFVRPIALLLALPALVLTLGLFLLVISVVSWIGNWFIGPQGRVEVIRHKK